MKMTPTTVVVSLQDSLADQMAEQLQQDGGYGGTVGAARRAGAERHLSGNALRGLGRQDRDTHHGAEGVHQPIVVRAGGRAGPAGARLTT